MIVFPCFMEVKIRSMRTCETIINIAMAILRVLQLATYQFVMTHFM